MEDASSTPNDNGQQQEVQAQTEEAVSGSSPAAASPNQQRRYKYDAGDAVILHGLIQSTHVNGRRAVVHFPTESYDDMFPPGFNPANAAANNDANNGNDNSIGDDDDERRCMVRLLPARSSNNNIGSDNDGSTTDRGGDHCISVKAKNLTLDYPPGQSVLLQGLIMAKHLNGRLAKIIGFRKGKRTERFLVEVKVPVCHDDHVDDEKTSKREDSDRNRPLTVEDKLAIAEELNAQFSSDAKSQLSQRKTTAQGMNISPCTTSREKDVDATPRETVKQILVSPKNITHLPGMKPPPIPPLDQQLIFTGTVAAVVRLLNQSVHKVIKPHHDFLEGRRLGLLGHPNEDDEMRRSGPRRVAALTASLRLWGKIQQRSYRCRGGNVSSLEDGNNLPPFYQRLVPSNPSLGRTHRVCFNPSCYAIIPPGSHRRIKRCTKCHSVAYCNKECALEAWDHHRKVCRAMREEDVRFAECVTLTSPRRDEVIQTQRMIRLCVNRIASLDDPVGHFERMGQNGNGEDDNETGQADAGATAKLLYDAITQGGTDVANEVLLHLENPPPVDGEVTVAIGFNSLGRDATFCRQDIQLFANIYSCTVNYRVLNNGGAEEEMEDVSLQPNDDEIPVPNQGLPNDVTQGFLNFLNNLMPGAAPPGMNNANDAPPGAGMNDNNNGEEAAEEGGGGDAAADNNADAAAQVPLGMPPEVANFLHHVMNEAGVGDFGQHFGNDNNGGDNNNGNAAAEDESALDENQELLEDVADVAENNVNAGQPHQQHEQGGGGGGFHFNFPGGGEAHVHVAHVNGNDNGVGGGLPPEVPMPPPGAFFQMPGMPVGVQVAVAQAEAEDFPMPPENGNHGGVMAGMPPPGAFQPIPGVPGGFHAVAGPFPIDNGAQANQGPQAGFAAAMLGAGVFGAPPEGDNRNAAEHQEEEEAEMEIED